MKSILKGLIWLARILNLSTVRTVVVKAFQKFYFNLILIEKMLLAAWNSFKTVAIGGDPLDVLEERLVFNWAGWEGGGGGGGVEGERVLLCKRDEGDQRTF